MANQFASDKKYLELAGLRALILKIGAMREEYVGYHNEDSKALARLERWLDSIVAADEDGTVALPNSGSYKYDDEATLFECVAKYIQDIRDELGASEDAKEGSPIYARLEQIENWVNNGFETEDKDGKTIKVPGLLDRTTKLEKESFAGVVCSSADDVKTNHLWEAIFKNAAGEPLKTADGKDIKISLDTKDFIIDGMLGDVKMVSVEKDDVAGTVAIIDLQSKTEPKTKYGDGGIEPTVEPWITLLDEARDVSKINGERYLVFSFKTTDVNGHESHKVDDKTELVSDYKNPTQNIWVSMKDLHDNFNFKGEGAKYIELHDPKPEHTANGSTEITYKVNLTEDAIKVLDWALGENPDKPHYEEIDADIKQAQEDIVTNREDIDNNRKHIGELQGYVKDGWETTDKDGKTIDVPGLLDRADDVEAWINGEGVIPAEFVEDYFDFIVFSGNAKDDRIDAYNKINDDPKRGIDKTWAEGHIPNVNDDKYKPALPNE